MKNLKSLVVTRSQNPCCEFEYLLGLKTVGNTSFFKRKDVRATLVTTLNQVALSLNVTVLNVSVFDYGLSFKVITPRHVDINKLSLVVARTLLQSVNRQFPELKLTTFAPGGSLSRIWHRPYYLLSLTPEHHKKLADYFQ